MSLERFSQPHENTFRTTPLQNIEKIDEQEPSERRFVSLSDIHNDILAMRASLKQKELVDADGEWRHAQKDVHLVITGDSINKHNPNPEILKYLHHLQKTAPERCTVTVLVGNHELDLLTRDTDGEDIGLKEKRIAFFEKMSVVSKQGHILFLHRYPSLPLIEELEAQYREHNGDVPDEAWHINERFQHAVATRKMNPQESRLVFQECDDGGDHNALEGLTEKEYYKKYGDVLHTLLERMGVTIIVHGHKRHISGGQHFEDYIPGIVMINNDTALSSDKNPQHKHRIASADISLSPQGTDITCVYKESIKKHSGDMHIQQHTIH